MKARMERAKEATLIEHLRELRRRFLFSLLALLAGSIVSFLFFETILEFFLNPFQNISGATGTNDTLFVNSLLEGFLTKLKISIFVGLILSMPIHMFNGIAFIFPGLNKRERRIFIISLFVSFLLIIFSVHYAYHQIVPLSIQFLTSHGFVPDNVGLLLSYGSSVFYILQFLFVSLVVFQIPLILEIAMVMDLIKRERLTKASRFVVFAVFVLSAILTPPDFISQIAIAAPLIVLYFLTLLIARIFRFGEG